MPSMVEQLRHIEPFLTGQKLQAVERAATVCALVEAFQAAEKAWEEIAKRLGEGELVPPDITDDDWLNAQSNYLAAKARLLEVNLGW